MSIPKDILDQNPSLSEWSILTAYRGSMAHGMWTSPKDNPNSIDDRDVISIVVPPLEYYIGFHKEFGSKGTTEIKKNEWDILIYELRKTINMLYKGNPNILSLLWTDDNYIISQTPAGEILRNHRDIFVGRHVYQSFIGYAKAQFVKMERGAYRGYMGERRKALVDKYGYDVKCGAHLIRLLRMGIEFLSTGQLQVDRGNYDAAELLSIKHGEWSLEKVRSEAGHLFRRAEDVYDKCTLPDHPDPEVIGKLCMEIMCDTLSDRMKMIEAPGNKFIIYGMNS